MKRVVFYSWQSDLPNATNRGFVQRALETAAEKIAADKSVEIEPVIDRDTQGVSGSPDISATIFEKIARADVVVADVSIICRPRKGRPTPNPNVLIELGYALRARGVDRVLMVFNEAYGKLADLPFDLKTRRIITYTQSEKGTDRAPERGVLSGKFELALRTAFAASVPQVEVASVDLAISAIENTEPRRTASLKKALTEVLVRLDSTLPKLPRSGGTSEDLIAAIGKAVESVTDVAKLSEAISIMSDETCMIDLYRWFGNILERYNNPRDFSGHFNRGDFDYFKFLGYEMFVDFVALLLRDERWALLQRLLNEPIPMRYVRRNDGPGSVYWDRLSEFPPLLMGEGTKRGRLSFQADLIKERHSEGALSGLVHFDDYLAADLFLYLRTCGSMSPNRGDVWRSWSVVFMEQAPMFLQSAERQKAAIAISEALGAKDVSELKQQITNALQNLRHLFQDGFLRLPFRAEDIERIGSRP